MNQPGIFPFLDQIIKELRKLFSPLRINSVRDLPRTDKNSNTNEKHFRYKIFLWLGKFHEQVWNGRFQPTFYSEGKISLTFNQNIFTSKLFLFHLNDFTDATIQQCAIHQVSIITLVNFTHFFPALLWKLSFYLELLPQLQWDDNYCNNEGQWWNSIQITVSIYLVRSRSSGSDQDDICKGSTERNC